MLKAFNCAVIVLVINVVTGLNVTTVTDNGIDEASERIFGKEIKNFLEELRKRMHMNMTSTIGIPRLDPLSIDRLLINPEDTDLGVELIANNLKIIGIKSFDCDYANFDLIRQIITVSLNVPEIIINGDYEVDGIVGGLFNLHGNGDLNLILHNLKLDIKGKLHILFGLSVDITTEVEFDNIDVELDGLMGGGELQEYFNQLLSDVIPDIFLEYWPDSKPTLESLISKVASDKLKSITFQDLLDILSGKKDIFPPIQSLSQ